MKLAPRPKKRTAILCVRLTADELRAVRLLAATRKTTVTVVVRESLRVIHETAS